MSCSRIGPGHAADLRVQKTAPRADAPGVRIAFLLSLLALALLAPAAASAAGETRIVVGRDPGLSAAQRAAIRADAGVRLVQTLRMPNTEVVRTDDAQAALADLRRDPDVRFAEIDRVRRASSDDPDFAYQWALENTGTNLSANFMSAPQGTPDADMDVPDAWALGALGAGVEVAVVDSGVDAAHPDLATRIDTTLSRGFLAGATNYADVNGHGTHVSGIVAAARDNGEGIAGVAPGATVVALKALDDQGAGYDSDIAAAFDYAGDHHIPIVNASLGGEGRSTVLSNAIAAHPDTLFVFAAGNGGTDQVGDDNDLIDQWPCEAPSDNVVCVGASTQDDARASFSNYGHTSVDLFAPGEYIWSTLPDGRYDFMSGTSMASPAVAGEAALVLGAAPALSTAQLKAIVLAAVDHKPGMQSISVSGGRANAAAAVGMSGAPPAVDTDGDGVPDGADGCRTIPGPGTADGCPVQPQLPPVPPTAPAGNATGSPDADGDGRSDSLDACPTERAATADGCPLPRLRTLKVTRVKRAHSVRVRVEVDRAAMVRLKLERRTCAAHGKRCRWRTAGSDAKAATSGTASFTRRLARGRYRATVRLSSSAGHAPPATRAFKL
jgi:thermitase